MRLSRAAFALVAFLAAPGILIAQGGVPLGPEFRVNTYTTNGQSSSTVDVDSAGNFVVAWSSYFQDGSFSGVYAQRYSSTGSPVGAEFLVNTFVVNHQGLPSVAADSAGNFVVVWEGFNPVVGDVDVGIIAQRYANTGAPLGAEFRVNSFVFDGQTQPSVTSASTGNFVVIWESFGQDGSDNGVFGQRFASAGTPLGTEFRVNTHTTDSQRSPKVTSDSTGNFVVAWESINQDGSSRGIFAQRYGSTGAPLGVEFRVNTYTTLGQDVPSVASDSVGNFIVVWQSFTQDGSGSGIFAQRYANTGAPLGGEFRVNSYTTGYQYRPAVAADSAGNFVMTWFTSFAGTGYGIFGQRYADTGAPLGGEFRVNTYTVANQRDPSVAADPAGNFVVTWTSSQDGNAEGVFAQRYSMIVPVELQDFRIE